MPRPSGAESNPRKKAANASDDDRQRLAEVCRLWGNQLSGKKKAGVSAVSLLPPSAEVDHPDQGSVASALPPMAPRLRQVLEYLLAGDGEKQIAATLRLSRHTVHDYVKGVYRRFNVNSRAELLALWIKKSGGSGGDGR